MALITSDCSNGPNHVALQGPRRCTRSSDWPAPASTTPPRTLQISRRYCMHPHVNFTDRTCLMPAPRRPRSWLTAAVPMYNPYCSCKRTRANTALATTPHRALSPSRRGLPRCGHPHNMDYPPQRWPLNHLGLRYNVLPAHQMALITSGCVPSCSRPGRRRRSSRPRRTRPARR